jgi:hypothetical protein
MEFVEHAIWLMKGGGATSDQQCRCKYCEPGQSQTAINYRLNHDVSIDDDDDDDDSGPGGRDPVNASLASRRRAIAAAAGGGTARGGRRTGAREKSPPILAKDYRVGVENPDPGPGPGPGPAT